MIKKYTDSLIYWQKKQTNAVTLLANSRINPLVTTK